MFQYYNNNTTQFYHYELENKEIYIIDVIVDSFKYELKNSLTKSNFTADDIKISNGLLHFH